MKILKTIIILILFSPIIAIFFIGQFLYHGVKSSWQVANLIVNKFFKNID